MAAVRVVLIAIMVIGLAAAPLVAPAFGVSSPDDTTAYASFAGGARTGDRAVAPMQNGNNNDNDDDNGDDNDNNGDDDDDDNDNNGDDDDDDNDNGDDDDDGDDNDNGDDGNDNVVVVVRQPNESVNRPTKCFDTREVGVVQLGTGTYDATVTVMPHSSFNQTTRLTLREVDPASVPVPSGALVANTVFSLDAQSSCDGAAINPLPNLVNLGIVYNVPVAVDKDRLQILRLSGGSWVEVDTVPDPVAGNPYVSATIDTAGTYALVQQ